MKPIILLDMDGVIADFFQHTMDIYRLSLNDYKAPKPWSYDIGAWIEEMLELTSRNNAWLPNSWFELAIATQAREKNFWLEMPKYPWTDELISLLAGYGEIYITTKPMHHPECLAQKKMWLDRHFPELKFIMTGHKHLLAQNHHILIDDHQETVENFIKHGGQAVLFPQPWNSNHAIVEYSVWSNRMEYVWNTLNRHLDHIENT